MPSNKNFGELLLQNLLKKQKALQYSVQPSSASVIEERPLPTYRFTLLNEARTTGIHIKAHTEAHTQRIGYLFHFELLAPPPLHDVGFQTVFRDKERLGFG